MCKLFSQLGALSSASKGGGTLWHLSSRKGHLVGYAVPYRALSRMRPIESGTDLIAHTKRGWTWLH